MTTLAPGVSLTMIVKNEESNIAACLESVRDLVDEIVVVDTGSTDATKSIAAGFGAKVFDFEWIDDFAAARNESLRHATREWIFWLDADDRLDEENRGKLRALFSELPAANVAYKMKCLSLYDVPYCGTTTTVCDQVRLFRNDARIRWKYRCHENISRAVVEAGDEIQSYDVVILHIGYQDPNHRLHKLPRNLRLLQLDNHERPNDPQTLEGIGGTLLEMGQPAEALGFLRESLALDHKHPRNRRFLMNIAECHARLGQREQALQVCREWLRAFPNDPDLLAQELWLTYAMPKIVCQAGA
jgi:glycosyltransferase involved in cell wall biosynthesis